MAKGEVFQVAFDAHIRLQALATQQGVAQVLAHAGINGGGQVAVQLSRLDAQYFGFQVEQARPGLIAFGRAPAAAGLGRAIGVAQLHVLELDAQPTRVELPLHIGLSFVDQQARLTQAQGPFDPARI